MKVLLDTNIIIHREANKVIHEDIGTLFQWLDKLHYIKCIHPLTIEELNKNIDESTVRSMNIKLKNYYELKTIAELDDKINAISAKIDITINDINDTKILNEVYAERVDLLISEDKKIHKKAEMLGISERVYYIDNFLERVLAEHPDLVEYVVLSVKKEYFGNTDVNNSFFDSLKEDYVGFEKWFKNKSEETAYVCYENGELSAILYLKVEGETENYGDFEPVFQKRKRLKVGTFKVTFNGFKLGERFLKIIFDNARKQKVEEIYVTIFDKRPDQIRLINLLEEWGFKYWGKKRSSSGEENIYVRIFSRITDKDNPKMTYPFLPLDTDVYIVPIYPEYHTELFPDSILKTESPLDYIENEPHRNAISKVYVSHSYEKGLKCGDLILFYRTGGYYAGVATTIGIVESVEKNIPNEEEFFRICRKRTALKEDELLKFWNRYKNNKPFVVNFLYAFSFPKRPNLKQLLDIGIIEDIEDMPRGFRKIDKALFIQLVKLSLQ